jgi:uncharacterized protein with PIN domain/sulfur carrier protein ThiS
MSPANDHNMMHGPVSTAEFRFYAELNQFLAPRRRQHAFMHACARDASVKHMIEALGVPHTEVALVLVNGSPVDMAYRIADGDRIAVYPHFRSFDADGTLPAQHGPEPARFIADAHLGQLARQLRMLGFDVLYRNSYSDAEVVRIALDQRRIVLTRDRDLLIRKDVLHGCYLHATDTDTQLCDILTRYHLAAQVRMFSRCLNCNGLLQPVDKEAVRARLPADSARHYQQFFACTGCGQVYWEGSHVARMRARMAALLQKCRSPA